MKSYGQYCGLAKALDLVGDRWSLLIVRELLIRGRCRYSDLQVGLPGIATNMLASRLRSLEEAEVVRRVPPTPPVATPLFELTPRGAELESVLMELGRWAEPLLGCPDGDEVCFGHWLVLPLRHLLTDKSPKQKPVTLEVRADSESLTIKTGASGVEVELGVPEKPDAVLTGSPQQVFAVLTGATELSKAKADGVKFEGDLDVLRRLQGRSVPRKKYSQV